jgi:hypothetical protein
MSEPNKKVSAADIESWLQNQRTPTVTPSDIPKALPERLRKQRRQSQPHSIAKASIATQLTD